MDGTRSKRPRYLTEKGANIPNISRSSKYSTETKSSKEKEIEDNIKVAELMAEAELLEENQILETEARKLKNKEELAKAKARHMIYLP